MNTFTENRKENNCPDRADLLSIVSADLQSVPAKIGYNANQKISIVDMFSRRL